LFSIHSFISNRGKNEIFNLKTGCSFLKVF
jgi:hypothetical protein